jgi:hypothetical protein
MEDQALSTVATVDRPVGGPASQLDVALRRREQEACPDPESAIARFSSAF